ncbi:hypothetical protein SSX86_020685 [Deinandra increscens subsp. villosa]|uniref:Zinc finger, CCHC-type n=1 Tax=Deinandra increscens subsp. villosa TaxID=3103831 RepID=A0AAP0CND3_9ASTR
MSGAGGGGNQVVRENFTTIPLQCPILNQSNYSVWAIKMKAIFNVHGLWDIVSPEEGARVDKKKDNAAIAYLLQSLPEELILQVGDLTSAKEIWEAIRTRYVGVERVMKARLQTLKSEYNALKMKDAESIDDFAGKLSGLASRSSNLGAPIKDSILVRKLLDSVPEKFIHIVASIEQFVDLDNAVYQEIVGRLKAFEERVSSKSKVTTEKEEKLLLSYSEWQARHKEAKSKNKKWEKNGKNGRATNEPIKGQYRNKGNGNYGSNKAVNSEIKKKDKSSIKCFKCDKFGHYASECAKLKEKENEVHLTYEDDDEPALLLISEGEVDKSQILLNELKVDPSRYSLEEGSNELWYLDNGASNHMSGNMSHFSVLDQSMTGKVNFGDGSSVQIAGKGSILLEGNKQEQKLLTEVYYIPSLKSNIMSLGQLTEGGCEVNMKGDKLWVRECSGRLLMKVSRSPNRLYKIALKTGSPKCFHAKMEDPAWLWHGRLGHTNFQNLDDITRKEMVEGVPRIKHISQVCEACMVGKQSRHPFPKESEYRASKPLELVSVDLCGPISPTTEGGNKYFMLLVDDFSRYSWGGEFTSREFADYCALNGIKRLLTAPYSPQQNGTVERRNRSIMNMTRSILKAMGMPLKYWAEAVRHSVYVLNRLPTKALKDVTPFQALRGNKPSLSHLKVFGCVGHVKDVFPGLKKLDDRSHMMVYLGVPEGTKGYRMLDVQKGRIVISRDVKFQENRKWNWDSSYLPTELDISHTPIEASQSTQEVTLEQQDPTSPVSHDDEGTDDEFEEDDFDVHLHDTQQNQGQPESSIRRSKRVSVTPLRLNDYVLEKKKNSKTTQEKQAEHQAELMLAQEEEPITFEEAVKHDEWKFAMKEELESIEKNRTWTLVDPPKGCHPIGLKWVFKIKRNATGEVTKYKARLVAKGYVQQMGIDYEEAFAPVARIETIRLILAHAAKMGWSVFHLDVKAAFLHGELQEVVYVKQPQGSIKKGSERKVYRLSKALYGLKQAPRAWNLKLNQVLKGLGFKRCQLEQAVYTRKTGNSMLIIAVYVDDLLVAGTDQKEVDQFKRQMQVNFEMTDMGLLCYYLGIEVQQRKDGIVLKQAAYAKKVVELAGLKGCNETKVPMEPGVKLSKEVGGEDVEASSYRRLVGSLRYLTQTRPDLAYAVGYVSRYMQSPKQAHMKAIKHLVRYVSGTLEYGLFYEKGTGDGKIIGYSDSNHAMDMDDGKSTSGNAFYYNKSLISWQSQKQRTVALSSCEAEFMAATYAACQALWLSRLLEEITGLEQKKVQLFVDNKSAIALMRNSVFHGRSKHIHLRFHFIRECIENGQIIVDFVGSDKQKADILTKPLARNKFNEMRLLLGVKEHKEEQDKNRISTHYMESILERYERYSYTERQLVAADTTPVSNWTLEYNKLKSRAELLQRNHRHYMGEEIESLSLKEIQNLEQQLDTGLKHIRTRKNQLLHESISELQKKGKAIQEQNTTLTKRIKEKEKDKTIPQNSQWQQHSYVDHDTTFLMPPPHPALNIGGDYSQVGGGGGDGRSNELDLSLQPIYSSHLRCFPS